MLDRLPYRNETPPWSCAASSAHCPRAAGCWASPLATRGCPRCCSRWPARPTFRPSLCPAASRSSPRRRRTLPRCRRSPRVSPAMKSPLEHAAEMGCKACGSPGGGCRVHGHGRHQPGRHAEALGLTLPHGALAPSGSEIWRDVATPLRPRPAWQLDLAGTTTRDLLTDDSIHNAMVCHAAFGGSTNLVLHVPAIAHAAGLETPRTVDDWSRINRLVPRLVDSLPNGPQHYATVKVYPRRRRTEAMLHLRDLGLLETRRENRHGAHAGRKSRLVGKEASAGRVSAQNSAPSMASIRITSSCPPRALRTRPSPNTVTFLRERTRLLRSALVKSTAISPAVIDADGVFLHEGPARVFTSEGQAIAALKSGSVKAGDCHGARRHRPRLWHARKRIKLTRLRSST